MAWDDIIGQESAKRLLRAHLDTQRIASAYLLYGPPGVGKRKLAFEMAKALNCSTGNSAKPCDDCSACRSIQRHAHPDVHFLEPGGASGQVKIESVRQLSERLMLRPYSGAFQVAIIEGANRLTEEAANSLLKVMEEPPSTTRFMLITAQLTDCLPTIRSRSQCIRCRPLPIEVVQPIVERETPLSEKAAATVARLAQGSAAEALSLASRWQSYEPLFERLSDLRSPDWFTEPLPEGRAEAILWIDALLMWLRDLAVVRFAQVQQVWHIDRMNALSAQSQTVSPDRCFDTLARLLVLRESVEQFANPKLAAAVARETLLELASRERHETWV